MVDQAAVDGDADEGDLASRKARDAVAFWCGEIDQALKREKDFRKDGREFVEMYEGGKPEKTTYNILYSNTETITPAVYSSTPRPNVRPRFKQGDQTLANACAKVTQSLLEFFVDCGDAEYSTFDTLMTSAVTEGLVPGRGLTRFKYDAEIEGQEGAQTGAEPASRVSYETVCGEEVPWDRVLFGFAKKWKDTPWMAIGWPMTRAELEENFGVEIGSAVRLVDSATTSGAGDTTHEADKEDQSKTKIAWVYEIWDKRAKRVRFVSEGYPDDYLRDVEDPYGLEGFFPCPQPLTFVTKIKTQVPVALYKLYEAQAEELNSISRRITALTKAMRVRGMYDATLDGIKEVLVGDDNTFVAAQNVTALQQGQTLESSIWMFPIQDIVGALQQLYAQREACKSVIYEITGIADIMRGSSAASETLGAQEIKTQWGGLRLKKLQKAVSRYAVESLRVLAEIALKKLSQQTIAGMTGLTFPTAAEKAQAQAMMQQVQASGQQVPPEEAARVQAVMAQPSWEDILGVLRSDLQRNYKIEIETNSTVDLAATEDKQDVAELMNALAQFMNGIAPLVESGSLPFEAAQALLLAVLRRFRLGPEVEESLKQMKPPPQQGEDPKAQAEAEKARVETQMLQQEAQQKAQEMQQKAAMEQQKAQLQQQQMQQDAQFATQEHAMRMQELQRKGELAVATHMMKMQQLQAKAREQAAAPTTKV